MFVFFDVGGTLLRAPRGLDDAVETLLFAERRVRSLDAIRDAIGRASPLRPLRVDDVPALERLFTELDFGAEASTLARTLRERAGWPVLAPGARAALELIRGAGGRLGVISNADEGLGALLGRSGLSRYLEVIMSSARAGYAKPDRRIFEAALSEAGVPAAEAWLVGDDLEADVRGARRAGLRAVWITESGRGFAPPDPGVWTASRADEAAYRILDVEGRIGRDGAA